MLIDAIRTMTIEITEISRCLWARLNLPAIPTQAANELCRSTRITVHRLTFHVMSAPAKTIGALTCKYQRRQERLASAHSLGGPLMRSLSYSGSSSAITVQVQPNCGGGWGSAWSVELACSQ